MFKQGTNGALLGGALALVLAAATPPAHAVDGCKVLMCIAANWRDISECRPDVEGALRDVARGKGWPECSFSGSGSEQPIPVTGSVRYDTMPNNCPEYFKSWFLVETENSFVWDWYCSFTGYIDTYVDHHHWVRTYYDPYGNSLPEWGVAAREAFPVEVGDKRIGVDLYHDAWVAKGRPVGPPYDPPVKPAPEDPPPPVVGEGGA